MMNPIIKRPAPASVTYDLSHPTHTVITLPPGSTWSSGLHFHLLHDEYLVVQQGSVRVRRDSEVQTVTVRPGDAYVEIVIPRGVWHEWARAPSHGSDQDDVVVVERTDPADGEKNVFFWNLNGVLLQQQPPPPHRRIARRLWEWWVTLQLFVIFAELDNVPVMSNVKGLAVQARLEGAVRTMLGEEYWERWAKRIDEYWSIIVLWVAHLVGRMLGVAAVRRNFMPEEAYARWEASRMSRGE